MLFFSDYFEKRCLFKWVSSVTPIQVANAFSLFLLLPPSYPQFSPNFVVGLVPLSCNSPKMESLIFASKTPSTQAGSEKEFGNACRREEARGKMHDVVMEIIGLNCFSYNNRCYINMFVYNDPFLVSERWNRELSIKYCSSFLTGT